MRGLRLLAAAILAIVCSAMLATSAGAATVSGTVSADGSAAVSGGWVAVYDAADADGYLGGAEIGSDGRYAVGGLPAGGVKVSFLPPYEGTLTRQYYRDKTTFATADTVELGSTTATVNGIDATLHEGAEISGTITTANSGQPLGQVDVDVRTADGEYAGYGYADDQGAYRVRGLAPGEYRVRFAPYGINYVGEYYDDSATQSGATPVTVADAQKRSGIDAQLAVGGRLSGHVVDRETGQAVQGVVAVADFDEASGASAYAFTDENGDYEIAGLRTGSYPVGFFGDYGYANGYSTQYYDDKTDPAQAAPVAVTQGSVTTSIDAALDDPSGGIRGTVADATGAALANINVEVYEGTNFYSTRSVRTDNEGRYRARGLGAGSYRIGFRDYSGTYRLEYYDDATSLGTAQQIVVGDGTVTSGIDARLEVTGRITGRITAEDTGGPLGGVPIQVYSSSGAYIAGATTGPDGIYTAGGLQTGSYRVAFKGVGGGPAPAPTPSTPGGTSGASGPSGSSSGYAGEFYDDKATLNEATPVAVTYGSATTGIDASLRLGGRIAGTVLDDDTSQPVPYAPVSVLDADGRFVTSTNADQSGRYSVGGVNSGSYRVQFVTYGGQYVDQYYNAKRTLANADPVEVTAGNTATLDDARLLRGGSITGTVLTAPDGLAATSGYVTVYDATSRAFVRSGQVGSDGRYTVGGLPTGSYVVFFYTPDYATTYYDGKTYQDADTVSVTEGAATSGINATLTPSSSISGTVTDAATGARLAGTLVLAESTSAPFGTRYAFTNADGAYTFSSLAPGAYRVSFEKVSDGYARRYYLDARLREDATLVDLTAGQRLTGIDGELRQGGSIAGTVTDATGAALANINVEVYDGTNFYSTRSVQTDAEGHYRVRGLGAGSYRLGFRDYSGTYRLEYYDDAISLGAAQQIVVGDGAVTDGIDARLEVTGRITGRVTAEDTGGPLGGVPIGVYSSSGAYIAGATTGPDGTYTAGGLQTGSYRVVFKGVGGGPASAPTPSSSSGTSGASGPSGSSSDYAGEFYDDKATLSEATPVAVTYGSATTGIDASLRLGGRIAGTVLADDTGQPVPYARVSVLDADGRFVASTNADQSGRYSVGGLNASSYRVQFVTYGGQYVDQYYNAKRTLANADPVEVTAGNTTTLDDARLLRGGSITGTVLTAPDGLAATSGYVTVYDATSRAFVRSGQVGSDGRYTVGGLPTGSYVVSFYAPDYATTYYDGKTYQDADAVSVTEGAVTSGIDATLTPPSQISGTVTDAGTGAPLANAQVLIERTVAPLYGYSTSTDASGAYTFSGREPGTYRVSFEKPSAGYARRYYVNARLREDATLVDLTAGQRLTGIDGELRQGGSIAGTVTAASTGDLVSGMDVTAYLADTMQYTASARTGTDGRYRLIGLDDGDYVVRFSSSGSVNYIGTYYNAKSAAAADHVTVSADAPTTGIDQVVQVGARVTGTLIDADSSTPIAGASVSAYVARGSDSVYVYATSGSDGRFTVAGLPTGSAVLSVSPPSGGFLLSRTLDAQQVTAGQDTALGDVPLENGGRISGTVRDLDSGDPIQGALVEARSSSGSYAGQSYASSDGTYSLGPLPTGQTYTVRFQSTAGEGYTSQYYDEQRFQQDASAVSVQARAVTSGIDARLTLPPTNTAAPVITGRAAQGATLSVTDGTWTHSPTVTRQWLRCDADDGSCFAISGATGSTYTLGEADGRRRIAVRETATNLGGVVTADSERTDAVVPLPPVNSSAPYIYGTPRSGETLSVTTGSWSNAPTRYAYQWRGCNSFGSACADITGATASDYVLADADIGKRMVVVVTAGNAGGDGDPIASGASSEIVRAVPVNRERPTISGAAKQGETLTTDTGRWDGEPSSYQYSWQRCDTNGASCVSAASGSSYSVRAADVGRRLKVTVTARNDGGTSLPVSSTLTDLVVATRPANTTRPSISGTAKDGETLTASVGSWTNEPTGYAYAWSRCPDGSPCEAIPGATARTFDPGPDEIGASILVQVVASNPGGASTPASSDQTEPVQPRVPSATSPPAITGTAKEGETLTAVRGTWTNAPTSYEYRWLRCESSGECAAITGATSETYVLVAADVDRRIVLEERAVNASGTGAPSTSSQTARVAAGKPTNVTRPVISGTAREGADLTVSVGTWTDQPTSYARQWSRCATPSSCVTIDGAVATRYTVTHEDIGTTIVAKVIATNAGGDSLPARSEATAEVVEGDPPETVILSAPRARTATDRQTVSFTSQPSGARFECRTGTEAFASCSSPLEYVGLAEGDYSVEIRARDRFDRVDPTPATVSWSVDRTAPDTTITSGPEQPVHAAASFTFTSTEPGGTFECAVDVRPYLACASGDPVSLAGLSAGEHTFRVRAIDAAANVDASGATRTFTFANAAPVASLGLTPDAGPIDLDSAVLISASDEDGDGMSFKLDYGDGSTVSGALPRNGLRHTYDRAGIYLARLEVSDGHDITVATREVTAVLAEPLRADAGDDLVAVVGESVRFDGRGSRPAAGVESFAWSYGDGDSGNGPQVAHTYQAPGTYTARLTVGAGGSSDSDNAQVRVVPADAAEGLGVEVASGGGPVAAAAVLVITPDGRRVSATTDGAGRARLHGLADGAYNVLTYVDGYLPSSTPASVSNHFGTVAVGLTPGKVAEASLTHRRLTRAEITQLGIDPDDPQNQNTFKFEVHLNAKTGGGSASKDFTGYFYGGGLRGDGCSGRTCRVDAGGSTTWIRAGGDDRAPTLSTFTLPGKARWLKEFFAIEMSVYNLGPSDFTLRNGRARLAFPDGLSLAPTARGEKLSQPVADIPGGGQATVDWIVRGDREGEYDLSADYAGSLEPFGAPVTVDAATGTPLKVWGGNALEPIIETDKQFRDGYPLRVRVGLRNVADIPVYDAEVELRSGDVGGSIDQPRQQYAYGQREIAAGETAWLGPWIFVPDSSGEIDAARSFVKQARGDDLGTFEIRTPDRVPTLDDTPRLQAKHLGEAVRLDWEPVPGASGYEVYAVPDRETAFAEDPERVSLDDPTSALIDPPSAGETPYYAVSSIVNGRRTMVHPLVAAPEPPPLGVGSDDPLGAPEGTCGLTRVRVGPAELIASCFTQIGTKYKAAGRVRVNGVDLLPQDTSVIVDTAKGSISVENVLVRLGNVVLYKGKLEWSAKASITLKIPEGAQLGKLAIGGEIKIVLTADRADVDGSVKLPGSLGGVEGKLKLVGTTKDGPRVDEFEISVSGLSVAGRVGLDEALLKYKRTGEGDLWTGGVGVSIPRPISPLKIKGELSLLNGGFKSVTVSASDINAHLGYGVFLQKLSAGLAVNPLALSGGIGISLGPSIRDTSLVSADGKVEISLGDPQQYSVEAELKVLDATVRSGYVRYRTDGFAEFGGAMGFEKGSFKAKAQIDGWIDETRAANAKGQGTFSVPGASFSAEGVVSSVGLAACRHGSGPDVGAGYRWGAESPDIFASSCDVGPYEAVRSRGTAGRGGSGPADGFTVAPDQELAVVAIRGDGAPPQVVLNGPGGARIAAPDGGRAIDRGDVTLIQFPDDDTTYVAIRRPAAGEWTIGTAPGSAKVAEVKTAEALPEPRVAATVDPAGGRSVLRWRLQPISGQEVQFVERTEHGARVIATSNEATGSAEFEPAPDTDAQREIVAVIEQDGLPRRTVDVEEFETTPTPAGTSTVPPPAAGGPAPAAPAPAAPGAGSPPGPVPSTPAQPATPQGPATGPGGSAASPGASSRRSTRRRRPTRPSRLRIRRRPGGVVVVTWSKARGGARYAVVARTSRGRRVAVTSRRRRLVIRGVRRDDRLRVLVRAVGRDGRRSSARVSTLRGGRR